MYYIIYQGTDKNGDMVSFMNEDDYFGRSFTSGHKFTSDPNDRPFNQHPKEPIRIDTVPGREHVPLPDFIDEPVPIMSSRLLACMRNAGVNNIDAYRAEVYQADGSLAPVEYFVVNVIGLVAAVDTDKTVYFPDEPDKELASSFMALSIDERKTFGFLLFRLAEDETTLVVHESVVNEIKAAGIDNLRFFEPEDIAVL